MSSRSSSMPLSFCSVRACQARKRSLSAGSRNCVGSILLYLSSSACNASRFSRISRYFCFHLRVEYSAFSSRERGFLRGTLGFAFAGSDAAPALPSVPATPPSPSFFLSGSAPAACCPAGAFASFCGPSAFAGSCFAGSAPAACSGWPPSPAVAVCVSGAGSDAPGSVCVSGSSSL